MGWVVVVRSSFFVDICDYYCEREVLSVYISGIVRSLAGCGDQSCSWVHKKGRDREKREYLLVTSTDQNCMLSS